MTLFINNFWITGIAFTCVIAFLLKVRSREVIENNPELAEGYKLYIRGILIYGNVPWVVMAVGVLTGSTHDLFEYLNPKEVKSSILAFYGSILVLWGLAIKWIYFKGGAEFIEDHPGLFYIKSMGERTCINAQQVKQFFPLAVVGGIIGLISIWVMEFPIPQSTN